VLSYYSVDCFVEEKMTEFKFDENFNIVKVKKPYELLSVKKKRGCGCSSSSGCNTTSKCDTSSSCNNSNSKDESNYNISKENIEKSQNLKKSILTFGNDYVFYFFLALFTIASVYMIFF